MSIFLNNIINKVLHEAEINGQPAEDDDDDDFTAGADEENKPTAKEDASSDNNDDDDEDYTAGADDGGSDTSDNNDDDEDYTAGADDGGGSDTSDDDEDYTAGADDGGESDDSDSDDDFTAGADDGGSDTSDDGGDDEDYTAGADDGGTGGEEGDDSEEGSSDEEGETGEEGGEDNSFEDLKKIEAELFSSLTPEQIAIKNSELKQRFIDIYETINNTLIRINDVSKSDNNIETLKFVTTKLIELRDMVHFNITTAYQTRTYIENSIIYQQCLSTLNAISDIINTIEVPEEQEEEKENNNDGIIEDPLEVDENDGEEEKLNISDDMEMDISPKSQQESFNVYI